jgi:hypothetical protein
MMSLEHRSLSPSKFEDAAGGDIAIWQLLQDCQVVHTRFGRGTIIAVERTRKIKFSVRFDQPYEDISERQFITKGFSKYIAELILPIAKFEQVQVYIAARPASKPTQSPRPEFKSEANRTQNPVHKLVSRVNLDIYRRLSEPKPKPQKIPADLPVKCPYCFFIDCFQELADHVRIAHPEAYLAWAEQNGLKSKRASRGTGRKKADSETRPDAGMVQCPLCECLLRDKNYLKHLSKVHPGKTAAEYPPIPAQSARSDQPRKRKKIARTLKPSWRVPSGKRTPVSMKVLNVGRKGKHYTRRD